MSLSSLSRSPSELAALSLRIRRTVLQMAYRSHSGHIGSAFSCIDLLVALYFGSLRLDPASAKHPDRDRFILSKGHACSALYAVLSERGFFPPEMLEQYLQEGSTLPGHPSLLLSGIEASTGSLGHGLGIGTGIALAAQREGKSHRTVVMISDGECDEGSTWEAALFAAHWKLSNLLCIIDENKIQGFGRTQDVLTLEPLAEKWRAFGWDVLEVDGHDHGKILEALADDRAKKIRPRVIIAHTVKGKGVSFMEDTVDWHYWTLSDAQYRKALQELSSSPALMHA